MGGVIAAHLASHYKEVKKLVLAAPAFRYFSFKDGKLDIKSLNASLKNIKNILNEQNTEQVISKMIKTPLPTIIEFTKLVNNCQNCVKNITCDTLIIHGTKDFIVPSEGTEYVHNNISSKTNILVNMENVKHECFTTNRKEEVKHIIKEFLTKKQSKKKETIEI